MLDVLLILKTLEHYGLVRLSKQSGDYYQVYCPHHKEGKELKPSCGVLLHDIVANGKVTKAGLWHCFSCGYAKPMEESITDILSYSNINQTGTEWLTANVEGYEPLGQSASLVSESLVDALSRKFKPTNRRNIEQLLSTVKPKYVSEEELASYRYTIPYMYERKLTDEIIAKYDVGFDGKFMLGGRSVPCITFPVRDIDGNTLFFCRRSVEGKIFHYPTGVTKPLFGIDVIPPNAESIIIVESCFNALTAVVYGYHAVALMGTGNSLQMQQLKRLGAKEYVLCFDGDTAGEKAVKKLKRNLTRTAFVRKITMPDGKDLNDCSKEEFEILYKNKSIIE